MSRRAPHPAAARSALAAAVCALSFVTATTSPAAAAPRANKLPRKVKMVPYEVQPGDSCWSIAQALLGKATRYKEIPYCRDKKPHVIPPGTVIRVPGDERPQAKVGWLQRDVRARPPRAVDWRTARVNMQLWRLYRVTTGSSSSAGIVFSDRSQLRMRSSALLVIYGRRATTARLSRRRKQHVRVLRGAVRGGLAALDKQKPLRVSTPSATLTLRSRDALVDVDNKSTSRVSVYDGKVNVAALGSHVTVRKDYGTTVKKGQRPARPRKLPAAPRWRGSRRRVVLAAAGARVRFEAAWRAVRGARRYRFVLSKLRDFRRNVAVAVVGAGVRRFRGQDLAPGRYFAKVSTRDRYGLESRPSRVLEVHVVALAASRRLRRAADGVDEVAGLVRLTVAPSARRGVELSLDGGKFRPASEPLRLRNPGLHHVRARFAAAGASRAGSSSAAAYRLRVLAVRADIGAALATKLAVGSARGRSVTVKVSLRDSKGNPAVLPGVDARVAGGQAVRLRAVGAGSYRGRVPLPRDVARAQLILSWAGGDLGQRMITVARDPKPAPKKPAKPAAFVWLRDPTVGLEWGRPVPGSPARSLRPQTRLGTSLFFADAPRLSEDGRATFMRWSLRGELALASGRLGLSADLPFVDVDLSRDPAHSNELGDARLGARWVAYDKGRLAVAPALRVTLPSGGFARARRDTLIEPAGLVLWRPVDALTLSTAQALVGGTDFSGTFDLYYSASYGAALRLWRRLTLAAELTTVLGLRGRDGFGADTRALALGGAARLDLGRARLSLSGGAGLTEDARELLGRFTLGVTLELGF